MRRLLVRQALGANVTVGAEFRVGRNVVISAPHSLRFGVSVSVGPGTIIQVNGSIGDFTMIGQGVQIVGRHDHATTEVGTPYLFSTYVADREPTSKDSVRLGRDVWVGGGSVIVSGVTIGEGALIGAGSVVTHDIPPYTIAVGNPAEQARRRFLTVDEDRAHHDALLTLAREWPGFESSDVEA